MALLLGQQYLLEYSKASTFDFILLPSEFDDVSAVSAVQPNEYGSFS
jgi:hypothetical protein